MQNRYLDQLKSTNPEERREAIIALGKQKDPAALKPLAEIYQNDPDPALRELAFKAGRYIRSMTAEMPAVSVARATAPEMRRVEPDELRITTEPDVPVKASNVEKARGYFNLALDYQVRNQNEKAIDAMGKAIEANPNLRNDSMFINLAMELTNLGSGAAVRLLSDPAARKEFLYSREAGFAPEGKAKRKPVEEATWGAALVDVGIYAVVNGALVFFAVLVGFQALMEFFAASMASTGTAFPAVDGTSIGVPLALIYALIYAAFAVIGLLIYYGAIHLAATTVLGGDGTMPELIRKVTIYYTILSVGLTLLSFVPIIFLNDRNLYNAFQAISFIASLIGLVFLGKLVGDAYQFGTGKGCASIFVGTVGIGILFACCAFALFSALSQASVNAGGF